MSSRSSYGPQITQALANGTTPGLMGPAHYNKLDAMPAWVAADETNLDLNTAARHTHANQATLDLTTAAFTAADEAKLDRIASPAEDAIFGAVALGNSGWTTVCTVLPVNTGSSNVQFFGHITFRNTSGGDGIGYFRVRRVDNSQVVASGQADVRNNQRQTVGFGGLNATSFGANPTATQLVLEARSSVASGVEATHQNGLGDGYATLIALVTQS